MAVQKCIVFIGCIIFINVATFASPDPYPQLGTTSTPNPQAELAAIDYIGVGYNIFKGNPDGGSWSHGGHDPGVHVTERILNIDKGISPSQIQVARYGCQIFHDYNLIYNPKSYQERLRLFVQGDGSHQFPGGQYAFTLSEDYDTVYHQTQLLHYVFQEYTTACDVGDVIYNLYSAMEHEFPLSETFAYSLCNLPELYSQSVYMDFLETWGTHVIVKNTYGKRATNRYRIKLNDYFNYLLKHISEDISEGPSLMGFQTSLKVNMDSFRYRPEFKELAGVIHQQITSTDNNYYDNNKLKIISMDTLISKINNGFWYSFQNIAGCINKTSSVIQVWSNNLGLAISDYPAHHSANAPQDTDLDIPLTWPNGTYSLQSTTTGCPGEVKWFNGTRYEELETHNPGSAWSAHDHFGGTLTKTAFTLTFCTKIQDLPSGFELDWPNGDYCVYKYGLCPTGFQSGLIYIDDEDTTNSNSHSGVLPDGIYNSDTTFNYCCRSDGTYLRPVWLPNAKPFYLFKYKNKCQKVQGMVETEETLTWDDEDDEVGGRYSGSHPAVAVISRRYPLVAVRTYADFLGAASREHYAADTGHSNPLSHITLTLSTPVLPLSIIAGGKKSTNFSVLDADLEIPLTWPNGTFSLQSTTSGCPGEIKWFEGTRHEEMERQDPDSTWSAHDHFGGTLTNTVFTLKFCTKVQNSPTGFEVEWPSGDYCIYKYRSCPPGFQSGSVFIDDEDTANKNSHSGVLPDGIYNSDTTFNYCCRSDGTYLRPIWLPNTKPFYLFKYKNECQKVQGMIESEEYLFWDGEDDATLTHDSGSHPATVDSHYAIRVYYCYYTPVMAVHSGTVIGK